MQIPKNELEALIKTFPKGVVALDLETTGLSPLVDKIIELSALKIDSNGNIETFDVLIDPKIKIPEVTRKIHGISNEMVDGKEEIQDVLPKFFEFIGDLPLVAHNAKFDLGFIVFHAHKFNLDLSSNNQTFCSCQFARNALKAVGKFNLAFLCKALDITLQNHHRALDDSIACLRVFAKGLIHSNGHYLKKALLFTLKDFDKKQMNDIPEHLRELKKKLEYQELVEIIYKGGSYKNQPRPVRPISFLPMPAGNVLYAHCYLTNLYKSFSLKKISAFKPLSAAEKQAYHQKFKSDFKERP